MVYRVGINGFGRIGRQAFKAIDQGGFDDLFEVVAVNDLAPPETLATLLKLRLDVRPIRRRDRVERQESQRQRQGDRLFAENSPRRSPGSAGGRRRRSSRPASSPKPTMPRVTSKAGAEKVIISAPAKDEDITIVLGVNEGPTILRARCHLECVMHDELSGPGRQGAAGQLRHPPRHDDDGPLLHE